MAYSTNLRNFGTAEGRLTADPAKFVNKDGSVKVKFTLAVDDNFKAKDGSKSTQFLGFEAFISKEAGGNLGPYASLQEGDLIAVGYNVRSNNYTGADGKTVYSQILNVNAVDFKETLVEKQARQARKANKATIAAAGAAAPAPAIAAPVIASAAVAAG